MATLDEDGNLNHVDAWPPYEAMAKWLDEDPDHEAEPILDLPYPEVSQHSLMESRASAVGDPVQAKEQKGMLADAKEAIESGRVWDKQVQV